MDADRTFRVVSIFQSDGKLEWKNPKTSKMESNAPPKLKPSNSDKSEMGYEELPFSDKKHLEWRKKLGTLLVQNAVDKRKAAGEDIDDLDATKYILGDLPENYKLYEGTRHEGTKLRKEVFVYGHPEGPKKRYRAAREFIPHLAWLSEDAALDPRNCECKFCAPPDAQKAFEEMTQWQVRKYGIKVEDTKTIKTEPQSSVKAETPVPVVVRRASISSGSGSKALKQDTPTPNKLAKVSTKEESPTRTATTVAPANTESAKSQKQATFRPPWQPQQQNANPSSMTPKPTIAPNQKPTPPVTYLSPEQKLDSMPQKYMFRQGETVWFTREHGRGASGIGVVVNRKMKSTSQSTEQARYTIQPLSYPFFHPPQQTEYEEAWLKPWLAYSPPDPFHEALRNVNTPFYKLPWKDIMEGKWGEGDVEADGSIFAARTVDGTYTVFEPIAIKAMEKSYNGVFFGGEKIWRGEAVRLAGTSREGQILIVSDILEVTPAPGQPTELIFVGDVYIWKGLKPEERAPPSNSFLPQAVNLDLNYRNEVSRAAGKTTHVWRFLESHARFSWEDLKGRWYASRHLVPGLCDDFQQQVAAGEIIDAGRKINSQGDYALGVEGGLKTNIIKKETRAAAFGSSIPSAYSDFGITEKQYTALIGAGSSNSKLAMAGAGDIKSGSLHGVSMPNTLQEQQLSAQIMSAAQNQQIEQQRRLLLAQQAARQSQQKLAQQNAGQETMDLDFDQFVN